MLPSNIGGPVTREVAYLNADPRVVGPWLLAGMGDHWRLRPGHWTSLDEAAAALAPSPVLTLQAVIR